MYLQIRPKHLSIHHRMDPIPEDTVFPVSGAAFPVSLGVFPVSGTVRRRREDTEGISMAPSSPAARKIVHYSIVCHPAFLLPPHFPFDYRLCISSFIVYNRIIILNSYFLSGGIITMRIQQEKPAVRPRYSGLLVHPTSFPGPYGIGDLGQGAYDFIDFLYEAGQTLWQCLPLGPTGFGDSPYQAFSAFAGQPLIISPKLLEKDGLLTRDDLADIPAFNNHSVDYGPVITFKTGLLHKAFDNFTHSEDKALNRAYRRFCRDEKSWLDDYALFMSLKDLHNGKSWHEWDEKYQFMDARTRKAVLTDLSDSLSYYRFIQFIFFRQWHALKAYANKKGIAIIGDIPIFVSPDSADVWANQSLFKLDSKGFPTSVAGVPPDYFSATGQLWGNPLYNWAEHKKTGYAWWIARIRQQLQLCDYLRIDHFRGFEAYWSVPYGEETAINGKWIKGPGASLFRAVEKELGKGLPIFAEDLGVITPQVEKLRDTFGFPGMKVLQFAFNDTSESAFLPYLYPENCICYTGTHDNDTTVGWYQTADEKCRDKVRRYMNCDGGSIHWDFIRTALGSTARYAVFPLQDLFGYGSDCRMNTPGVAAGNWAWRYESGKLTPELARSLKIICEVYGRDRARMEVEE